MDTKKTVCKHGTPDLYNLFNFCFGVLFLGIALLSVFLHNNPQFNTKRMPMLMMAAVIAAGLAVVGFLCRRLNRFVEKRICCIMLLLYFLFLVWLGQNTLVLSTTSWDYGDVFRAAEQYVLHGDVAEMRYFTLYGNNLPLFWIYFLLFKVLYVFGIKDFMPYLILVNSVCIAVAMWCAWRIAEKVLSSGMILFFLLLVMGSPAVALYCAIAYTDTLSMPFVMGAALFWVKMHIYQKEQKKRDAIWSGCMAFVLTGFGASLKISVLILAIAFVIDIFVLSDRFGDRKRAAYGMALMGVVLSVLICAGCNVVSTKFLPVQRGEGIPFTHWIMMGLNGNGGYNDSDYQLTLQHDTYEERMTFTKEEIVRRVKTMGSSGLIKHLLRKLSYLYSDGTEWAPNTLARAPRNPDNRIYEIVSQERRFSGLLFYFADSWRLVMLLLCALGSWQDLRKGCTERTVFRVAVFGLTLFLLLWEACSRYVLNYDMLLLLTCFMPEQNGWKSHSEKISSI